MKQGASRLHIQNEDTIHIEINVPRVLLSSVKTMNIVSYDSDSAIPNRTHTTTYFIFHLPLALSGNSSHYPYSYVSHHKMKDKMRGWERRCDTTVC